MAQKWEDFLKDVVKGYDPDIETEYSAFADILAKPASLIFPPILSEIEAIIRNQTLANYGFMDDTEMDRLMANRMLIRYTGEKSTTVVRMYFSQPFDINIPSGTQFTSTTGINFLSTQSVVLSYDQMNVQMEGRYFYVDVGVEASDIGSTYNIPVGSINGTSGTFSYLVRISNRFPVTGGRDKETNFEFMRRGTTALGIRDFACKLGIETLLKMKFPNIIDMRIVSSGEEDMERDVQLGIHLNGKADVYIRTTSIVQKSQIIPAGTSIIEIGDIPEDATSIESSSIISDRPVISVDNIYLLDISDVNERTGDEIVLVGGFGMGGYGYGIFGQGSVQHLNREEPDVPYSQVITIEGRASFEKFSKVVTGSGTEWASGTTPVKRGDRIQRTQDSTDNYDIEFGVMYTVADIISDTELRLTRDYQEPSASLVNYRVQSYTFKTVSGYPGAVLYVRDFDNTTTESIRYSSEELAYIRVGREFVKYPLEVAYTTDGSVSEVQEYVNDHINKVVGLDLMIKHFVPIYVDMEIEYEGGPDTDRMEFLLRTVIDRDRIFDPEKERMRRLLNWNGDKWIFDLSDIVDLFYNSGCSYVKLPLTVSVERHNRNGGVSTESDILNVVKIDPHHHLISRGVSLTQKTIVER